MVSVFPWSNNAVLRSMEMVTFLNKYYRTNSSYHLRKLGMMFRVEVKKGQAKGLCVVLISLCFPNFCEMYWFYIYLLICE